MKRPEAKFVRDTVTFVAGLAGLAYEAISSGTERPTLIIAFLGLMGLPIFLRSDETRAKAAPTPTPPTPPQLPAIIPPTDGSGS